MNSDLGHEGIADDGLRVLIDPRLKELPRTDLLEIIERQANTIRVLQHKARERAAVVDDLERQLRESQG